MATARPEDQVFFLYDHTALQKEEDDLKDAIKYFFPSSITVDDQCALCGQLMGMVEYFVNFLGKSPKLYKLQKNKIAVKRIGKYTMALAGNLQEPDRVIFRQLDSLFGLFLFYQGGIEQLHETCTKEERDFMSVLQSIWDCYLPFIRRYGDSLTASFESIPTVEIPKNLSSLFLQATHLLQYTGKQTGVLSGCLLYKGRVLCTQLPPDITSRVLIIRPKQAHFPCRQITPGFQVPAGVRILSIFLTLSEYEELNIDSKFEGRKSVKRTQSDSRHLTIAGAAEGPEDIPSEPSSTRSNAKLSDSDQGTTSESVQETISTVSSGAETEKSVVTDEGKNFSILKDGVVCVHANQSEDQPTPSDAAPSLEVKVEAEGSIASSENTPDNAGKNEDSKDEDADASANLGDINIELAEDTPADDGSGCECPVKDNEPTKVQDAKTSNAPEISALPTSQDESAAVTSQDESSAKEKESPSRIKKKSDTATLFQNLKKVAARNSNVLENITRQMEMENAFESDDDEDSEMKGLSSLLADLKKDTEALASATEESSNKSEAGEAARDSLNTNKEASPKKSPLKGSFNHRMLLKSPGRQTSVSEGESDKNLDLNDVSAKPPTATDSDTQQDVTTLSDPLVNTTGLVNLDLFVQGNSEIVLLLLMEKGAAGDCDTVRKLWKATLPQLGDLEVQLKSSGLVDRRLSQQEQMAGYNYLTYDNFMKSLSGNMLRPMSSNENDFCETAILMKDEFEKTPKLIDVTLRTHTTSVYGHRSGSQQVYYQPKDGKPQPGIPSARDPNVGLDSKAYMHLLKDQNIHVI